MARNHARIFTSIWNDDDFLDLSSGAQRVYLLLLSQQNLSHAGLLPLTVTRWANKAKDTTVEQFEGYLEELGMAGFVVIDEHTEELLLRSFMRRDEVYKQPNVMAAAVTDAKAVASPALRRCLAVEVQRIRAIEGLAARVITSLETLSEALPNPSPSPSEPQDNPSPRATGMGKGTEVSRFPAPSTSTSPATGHAADTAAHDDPTSELLLEHVRAYAEEPPPDAQLAVKQQIMRLVAQRIAPERIRAGLARLRERGVHPNLLPHLVAETTAVRRTSTTDQRVATGAALVEHYRALEA